MHITILKTGDVPPALADHFENYPSMFATVFQNQDIPFTFSTIDVNGGETLPNSHDVEAIIITGSSAGVYEDHAWLPPLRSFIRDAYAENIKMLGICFGHQIIADALGGIVEKSDKGWGIGRHTYDVKGIPHLAPQYTTLSIGCSHQDQVITPPKTASVVLSSQFAPNAGLIYANGNTLTFQPHPEFSDEYLRALANRRRGAIPEKTVDTALESFTTPSSSPILVEALAKFFKAD